MINKVLSIEIGELKTKLCVLDYQKKHPKVFSAFILDTPDDCCSDGFIKNRAPLADAIAGKLRENKINVSDVVFSASSSRIATHEAVIPFVKPKEIMEVINAGASNYFPINLSDYILSYIILEKVVTKQQKNYRLLVIAAPNNLISSYYDLAKDLKLNIVSIDYLNNSILQIIKKQPYSKETDIYIQMNEQNTLVNIMNDGVLKLHRTIAYGLRAAVKAAMNCPVYKIDNEIIAMELLSNEPVINTNLSPTGENKPDNESEPETGQKIRAHKNEVTETLRYLIFNINRAIEYYSSKNEGNPVRIIHLSGMGVKFKGLDILLSNETGIPVKFLDKIAGVNLGQASFPADYTLGDFSDCIGAAIAPLDLIPKQYALKLEKINRRQAAAVICTLSLVTCTVLIFVSTKRLSDNISERKALKETIARLEAVESNYSLNRKLSEKKKNLAAIEKSCYGNGLKISGLIKELESKLPDSAVLSAFSSNETGIIMDVSVRSEDALAMSFLQMGTINLLTNVKTEQITRETTKYGETILKYIITASYAVR